jgi:hypothetical protein
MLALLKQAMLGVMEGDGSPLQKANALTRLGNLYLKAAGAAELMRACALLQERLAEVEQRLEAVETRDSESDEAGGAPAVGTRRDAPGAPVKRILLGETSSSGTGERRTVGRQERRLAEPATNGSKPRKATPSGKTRRRQ